MSVTSIISKKSFLYFSIADELFAIDTKYAIETLSFPKITKVPKSSDNIKGVVNFRGDILPIIDLHRKLNFSSQSDNNSNIIVIDIDNNDLSQKIGFIVDKVKGVVEIPLSQIKSVPEMNTSYNTSFLSGVFQFDNQFVMLLNVDHLFNQYELAVV